MGSCSQPDLASPIDSQQAQVNANAKAQNPISEDRSGIGGWPSTTLEPPLA